METARAAVVVGGKWKYESSVWEEIHIIRTIVTDSVSGVAGLHLYSGNGRACQRRSTI